MAKHKPRGSAPTEYTTDDEDMLMFNIVKDNWGRWKQHSRTLRGSFMAPRKPRVLTLGQCLAFGDEQVVYNRKAPLTSGVLSGGHLEQESRPRKILWSNLTDDNCNSPRWSVISRTIKFVGVSRTTVSRVITAHISLGKVYSMNHNSGGKSNFKRHERRVLKGLVARKRKTTIPPITSEMNTHLQNPVFMKTIQRELLAANIHDRVAIRKPLVSVLKAIQKLEWCRDHLNQTQLLREQVMCSDESLFTLFQTNGRVFNWQKHRQKHLVLTSGVQSVTVSSRLLLKTPLGFFGTEKSKFFPTKSRSETWICKLETS
ncbi:transposable element Tc1 transposase [Trichonephila clavipes]|nr:transposable element Tc1 transposase [Trichonephila clavipes]